MASLIISTNWAQDGSDEMLLRVMDLLATKVAALAGISQEEMLVELRTHCRISFASSCQLAAHALWAFGGSSDKNQNLDLHRTVSSVLESYLAVPPERLRITRVQLYEILDHNTKTVTARAKTESRSPTSPTSPRSPKMAFSPRSASDKKDKEKKKGWSKSLERKKAAELTAAKPKKSSQPSAEQVHTDNMLKILEESDSSDRSGTSLLRDEEI